MPDTSPDSCFFAAWQSSLRIGNGAPGSGIVAGAIHCFPLAPWICGCQVLGRICLTGTETS